MNIPHLDTIVTTKKGTHLPSKSSFTQNIILDCLRRDFTINAIYYDILKDNYLDYVKGMKDIKKRKNLYSRFASSNLL